MLDKLQYIILQIYQRIFRIIRIEPIVIGSMDGTLRNIIFFLNIIILDI